MTDNSIEALVKDLEKEEERLKQKLSDVKKEEQETIKELERVQAGLSGLRGNRRSKKGTASGPRRAKRPRAGDTAKENLRVEHSRSEDAPRPGAEKRLRSSTASSSDSGRRSEEALEDQRFVPHP